MSFPRLKEFDVNRQHRRDASRMTSAWQSPACETYRRSCPRTTLHGREGRIYLKSRSGTETRYPGAEASASRRKAVASPHQLLVSTCPRDEHADQVSSCFSARDRWILSGSCSAGTGLSLEPHMARLRLRRY